MEYSHWAFLGKNVAFSVSHFDSSGKSLLLPLFVGCDYLKVGKENALKKHKSS